MSDVRLLEGRLHLKWAKDNAARAAVVLKGRIPPQLHAALCDAESVMNSIEKYVETMEATA